MAIKIKPLGAESEGIDLVEEAYRDGRTVVPLLGTGISFDAGIPTLSGVTRYLAQVKTYVDERVYRNLVLGPENADKGPSTTPLSTWEYLRRYGWPNPNKLTAELWHWRGQHSTVEDPPPEYRQEMDRLVDSVILKELEAQDQGFIDSVKALRELARQSGRPWNFDGDHWQRLLARITRSDPDLVDLLFERLVRSRRPSRTHRYLTFLSTVLEIQLFLTTNFDRLLEKSFRMEGLPMSTWEVADGGLLPESSLLRNKASIIKLHGGRFRLLWDQRLNRPLDQESEKRLGAYFRKGSLILAMGLGGWDQRILDILEIAIRDAGCSVLWLHFEDTLPEPIRQRFGPNLQISQNASIHTCRVAKPAGFLERLFARLTRSIPCLRQPYRAYQSRPVPQAVQPAVQSTDAALTKAPASRRPKPRAQPSLYIFVDREEELGLGASYRLAQVVQEHPSHLPVWINLESKFSVEEIVTDILLQLRNYDPSSPPEIIAVERSIDSSPESAHRNYRKATSRILSALGRGRYFLAFEGLASFGRPATAHHAAARAEGASPSEATSFLMALLAAALEGTPDPATAIPLRDSILGIAASEPQTRSLLSGPNIQQWEKLQYIKQESLVPMFQDFQKRRSSQNASHQKALAFLSCFRIRRTTLQLDRLGSKYGLDATTRSEILGDYPGALSEVSDGSWWMARGLRNRVYSDWIAEGTDQNREETRKRLSLLLSIHRDLLRSYSDLYSSSVDRYALAELLFHQTACIRLQCRLRGTEFLDSPTHLGTESTGAGQSHAARGSEPELGESGDDLEFLIYSLSTFVRKEKERLRSILPAPSVLALCGCFLEDVELEAAGQHCGAAFNHLQESILSLMFSVQVDHDDTLGVLSTGWKLLPARARAAEDWIVEPPLPLESSADDPPWSRLHCLVYYSMIRCQLSKRNRYPSKKANRLLVSFPPLLSH